MANRARARGSFLFFARRYTEAVARLDAALDLEPAMWQAHIMRAYPLIELTPFDEAICSFVRRSKRNFGDTFARHWTSR